MSADVVNESTNVSGEPTYRTIDIDWRGPFPLVYDYETGIHNAALPDNLKGKSGLYAVYGQHPVYGPNALLYIGQTALRSGPSGFGVRLQEQTCPKQNGSTPRLWYFCEMSVYVGVATREGAKQPLVSDLTAVESLLIASHMPALNRHYIDVPTRESADLLVFNWNNRGRLLSVCAGRLFFTE